MIAGETVRLRAIERQDLPRYVEWLNDPLVAEGLERSFPLSMAEEEKWFDTLLERPPAERPFAIDASENEGWLHVGGGGFHNLDGIAHQAELGIMIGDRSRWGRGYGTEAVGLLLRHGFETLNLNRIYLRVFEHNQRAIPLYLRIGFKEEGRLREGRYHRGRYWDTLVMGLLRREWDLQRKGGS